MNEASQSRASERALVTGGGGFLGGAIVKLLLERGYAVRSLARGSYPELELKGVETMRGDVADERAVARACEECDVVFHVAAKAGAWGGYEQYHRTNVTGTEHVLAACRRAGVKRLVYTSTPSVVFNGRDMEGVDESVPYAKHYEAHYPRTKAMAERAVLAANGPRLATVALRPHLIWGPGDNHLVPRILDRARAGKLRLIGKGSNLVDTVYIDNAAEAHLAAAERLGPGRPVAGKVYFITQDDPRPLREIVNRILAAAELGPVNKRVPRAVAYAMGAMSEWIYRALGRTTEPLLTRFIARELATAHWFDISAARRDLDYEPRVSLDEGMERLGAWLRGRTAGNGPNDA